MNITLTQTDKLARIGVLGTLELRADQLKLVKLLQSTKTGVPHQLDFYDADSVPPDIISALADCLDRSVALKILSYHPLLTHNLMRLGIPAQQVNIKAPPAASQARKALALAGSANSLDKILHIIEALPLSQVSIFIVQHVMENQINLLDQLLRVRTQYQVVMPQHLMAVAAATIYVAPPGHHMKVAHGLIYLTRDGHVQYARPSIDVLFGSLASEYGADVMAVLLCGFGRDGVDGCGALKQTGACVIIEDGDDCGDACVLPQAAIESGQYEQIMKLPVITSVAAAAICSREESASGVHLTLFIEALWSRYSYDFRGYQPESLQRRVHNIMMQTGLPHFFDFQLALFSDQAIFERMLAEISVCVTAFFRHPEQCQLLREQVFPYLASFPLIKCWSAGCATGEEPYSLAILLDELGLLNRSRLFATDFNAYLIEIAKSGLYPVKLLETSQHNYHKSAGPARFDNFIEPESRYLRIKHHLIASTLFHLHSLVDEGIFNEFQLIICRNVMIYFKPELQQKILQRFARSLHRDGFLVLGPQDGLHHLAIAAGFIPYIKGSHIYRLNNGGLYG